MNINDSDFISEKLSEAGFIQTQNLDEAEIVILNTCSIRANAEQKAFSYLGRLSERIKNGQKIKIAVIGCMAERLGSKIKDRFHDVGIVIGAKSIDTAPEKIIKAFALNTKPAAASLAASSVKFINIIRGCQNYCSYCVVPSVRGQEVSRSPKEILSEIERSGAKEVTLLGQNVNSYNYGGTDFAELLEKVCSVKGCERVRFMTNHPKDLSDNLIRVMAKNQKLARHVHLPLQSGSDRILNAMNRRYTLAHYKNIAQSLRAAMPDINITTDFIVGFPTETEEDFAKTLKAAESLRFGGTYIFKYSPRPNTPAYKLKDDVPLIEKKRRFAALSDATSKIQNEICAKMKGKTFRVFGENYNGKRLEAKTDGAYKVFIENRPDLLGKMFNVKITGVKNSSLKAEVI
jgi:tRNA-2-methylthio-N6-dimethylallyladenosine synthase